MNKFGPHHQRFPDEFKRLLERWQPPLDVWVDPFPSGVKEIRRISPDTFIIGRKNEHGHDWRPSLARRFIAGVTGLWTFPTSPEYWADECARMGQCDAYYWNEPLSHDERHLFAAFDEWQMRFRERIRQHGMEAVGLNMATGNFTKLDDIAACFPDTCATFRHLGIHEYDWIIDPAERPVDPERLGYYWQRWLYWLAYIGRDDVTLWVTECGWTQGVHLGRPDEGWRSGADGVGDDDYVRWAAWYNEQLVQEDQIGGAALFNFAGWGWGTFEHLDWPRLNEILALDAGPTTPQPPPQPPPPQPPTEEPMDIKVFDMDGVERDFEYAKAKYGVSYRRAEVEPGRKVYRLVELREKSGPASLVTKVLDEDGSPQANVDVAFYWPDAPSPPEPPTPILPHDWRHDGQEWRADGKEGTRFVHGPTNANGDVGPGMGPGAYHGPGEGGPHAVWVRDPDAPSDICYKLGMLAGTPHDHLDQKFKLTTAGGTPEPPQPPQGELVEIARLVESHDSARLCIAYPESIAYDTDVRAGITGSDLDLDTASLTAFSHDGKDYALGCVCCDYLEPGRREYWIQGYDLNTQEAVTPAAKETFSPRPDFRKVTVVFDFEDGEPPAPLPGDVAAELRMMAAARRAIAHHETVTADCLDKLAELVEG